MGNSKSKPPPPPPPIFRFVPIVNDITEIRRISDLNKEISFYVRDNIRLAVERSKLNIDKLNTTITNNNALLRLYGKQTELNNNIRLTTDSFNKLKNKNADPTDLRMTEITNINDKLQKDTLNYLLVDVNAKKNIYNLIKSQNNLIEKNSLDLLKNTDKNNQKYTYSLEQYNEIENINTIFLILYYFLFIIFLFFIVFKINYPVVLKIIIGLIFLIYPYLIYTIEIIIYNIIYSLYLYTFSIFTIENSY
jgi:hypothetical protein